jgi:hypothetical protein
VKGLCVDAAPKLLNLLPEKLECPLHGLLLEPSHAVADYASKQAANTRHQVECPLERDEGQVEPVHGTAIWLHDE